VSRNDEVRAKLHALVTTDQRLTMWEVEDNQRISLDLCKGILMTNLSMRHVSNDHPMTADSTAAGAPPVCNL
jgi:hypothetical protein